jgi:hypothetical protein
LYKALGPIIPEEECEYLIVDAFSLASECHVTFDPRFPLDEDDSITAELGYHGPPNAALPFPLKLQFAFPG